MSRPVPTEFELLQRQKNAFLATLDSWPPDQLCIRPAPAIWSALDVLDHLAKTQCEAFARMRENLNQPVRLPFRDRPRTSLRVRVPASVAATVLPESSADFVAVRCNWNSSQSQLKEWLSRLEKDPRSLAGFRHPVSGWMSVTQGLRFLAAHVRHHRYQLARLKRQLAQK